MVDVKFCASRPIDQQTTQLRLFADSAPLEATMEHSDDDNGDGVGGSDEEEGSEEGYGGVGTTGLKYVSQKDGGRIRRKIMFDGASRRFDM